LGREREARGQATEIMRLSPNFSLKAEKERMALQDQALGRTLYQRPAQGGAEMMAELYSTTPITPYSSPNV